MRPAECRVLIARFQVRTSLTVIAHNFWLQPLVDKLHRSFTRCRRTGKDTLGFVAIPVSRPVNKLLVIVSIETGTFILRECGHAAVLITAGGAGCKLMVLAAGIINCCRKLLKVGRGCVLRLA